MNILKLVSDFTTDPEKGFKFAEKAIFDIIKKAETKAGERVYIQIHTDIYHSSLPINVTMRTSKHETISEDTPASLLLKCNEDPQIKTALKTVEAMFGNLENMINLYADSLKNSLLKDGNYIIMQNGKEKAVCSLLNEQNDILQKQKTLREIWQIHQEIQPKNS